MTLPAPIQSLLAAASAAVILAGCATTSASRLGRQAADTGDWDLAVAQYSKALSRDPQNIEFRKALEYSKVKASQAHAELAKNYKAAGALDLCISEYRMATSLDPTNRYVADSLENALMEKQLLERKPEEKSDIEKLKDATRGAGAPAVLQPRSNTPLTLNFPPSSKIKDIYTALGKASGINFLFDSGIKDSDTFSIDIANISFRKALDQVAIANRHFYKSVDPQTLMVIPDNPQKRRDYEDNVIKTFYLSNAAPNDVVNTLRGLLDARRLAVNVPLNAITIRDTPAKIEVMERIIQANDRPPSEVVIDVEIVELQRSKNLEYGAGLTDYRVNQVLEQNDEVGGVKGLRLSSLPFINASSWLLTFPGLVYRARKGQGSIRTLARPSLRALDGKQVTLRLGDQVPIETSTFTATSGGNTPLTRNFQFRDIGTNVDITPRVHHNNEVTLMLQVEVTSIGDDPDGAAGPIPPTFGNRRINTEIRLKDGETNLLAGLFTSSEEKSRSGLPILSDIPVLKTFFAQNSSSSRETDIVITLTPHIVRTPNLRKGDFDSFYVGTEANVGGVSATGLEQVFGKGTDSAARASSAPDRKADEPEPEDTRRPSSAVKSAGPVQDAGTVAPPTASPGANVPTPVNQGPEGPAGPAAPGAGSAGAAGAPATTPLIGSAGTGGSTPATGSPTATPTPSGPPPTAMVLVVPATQSATLGSEFSLEVSIAGARGVSHAPFYLSYDPAILEYLGANEGGFLRSDGKPTQFLASGGLSDGRVVIGLSRVGRVPGVDGGGQLATFRFRAKAKGVSPITLMDLQLRDFSQKPLPANGIPGTVTVP